LPNRHALNAVFLAMAAGAGMTSAIMNPLHDEEMSGVMASDVLLGKDKDCRKWIRKFRAPPPEGSAEAERAGRRRRRG
jgi:5-methyltetrahydrofolate--homocysteine methyltransferase